ncbi:MAG: RDD family protein [Tepidiformaceae bacterium]
MTVSQAAGAGPRGHSRPAHSLRYATFEARVVASVLDLLVLFIIASLLITAGSLVILFSSDFEKTDASTTAINIFWGCAGAILPATLLYLFIGLAWKGQTVGAAVMQIMVVRCDGRRLGVLGALARVVGLLFYCAIIALGVIAAYALQDSALGAASAVAVAFALVAAGIVWAAFDAHRRMLHDRLAGTIVVRIA